MKTFVAAFLALTLFGCGQNKIARPEYPGLGMKNVDEAPEALRKAAEAVVLISTGGSYGTGSWVSKDGRLLTNNHVLGLLGSGQCAREGCNIQLGVDFQLGSPVRPRIKVFAEPLGVQPEFDVAVFQIWTDETRREKFVPPHHLEVLATSGKDLRGQELHVIGHPVASVKKWATGQISRRMGKWIISSHFGLPGNSGSPILNNSGQMVGIIHRGYIKPDDTDKSTESMGSAGSDFHALISAAANPEPFFSVQAVHTEAEVLKYDRAYLAAGVTEAKIEAEKTKPVIDILIEACDAALETKFFESPDAMSIATTPCASVMRWLKTLNQAKVIRYEINAENQPAWESRFKKYRGLLQSFNNPLGSWLFVPTGFDSDPSLKARPSFQLAEYLEKEAPEMSFALALFIVELEGASQRDAEAIAFLRGYRNQPAYAREYETIYQGLVVLLGRAILSFQEFERETIEILNDEKLFISDKLIIEEMLYRSGLL